MKPVVKYLSAYIKTRCYGGAEEGGWWYNNYTFVAAIQVKCKGFYSDNTNTYLFNERGIIKKYQKEVNKFIKSLDESETEHLFIEDFVRQNEDNRAHYYE